MDTAPAQVRWAPKVSALAGAISLVTGLIVLMGWRLGVRLIVQPVPQLPAMMPNTASWFVLTATSLLLLRGRDLRAPRRRLAQVFVLVVIGLAGATLAEHVFHRDLRVDQFVIDVLRAAGTGFPSGRSAPGTSAAFALLGLALLTLDSAPAMRISLPETLASGAALIALLTMAGYVYGATSLYASRVFPHMGSSPHTTLGLLLLSAGVVCLRPERALIGLLTSSHAGGMAVRRLLIGALTIPILGLLILMGARASLYTESFADALLAVVAMAVAVGLILATGRTLGRIDAARTVSEHEVADREARLRDLIAQASDGIFIADLDGRYKEVNDAGCDMLGYRREDLVGKSITDLIPAAEIPRLQSSRTLLLRGASMVEEWTLRRSDGTYLPVEVSAKILPDGRWQGLVRDISARKDVERAGQAMAEAGTGAAESSLHAVLRTIGREARIAADAEYVALGLGDEVPPQPAAMRNSLRVPIRSRGHIVGTIYLANKRRAAEFTAADQWAVEQLAGRAGTIIEAARLYQTEGLQRAWLEATVDQMPEGVVVVDANGVVQLENRVIQAFAHDTGQRDQMGHPERYDLRLPNGEPLTPDDRPRIRALADGVTTRQRSLLLGHPDGRLVPVLVSSAPVFDAEGGRSGAVTIYQDISALKELERQREEWSSLVAHDLRQPLSVIAMGAEMLSRMWHHGNVEHGPKVAERIHRSTRRMNKMIDDLLDVSVIEGRRLSLDCTDTDLAAWLSDVVERLSALAPGHPVQFRREVRPAPAFIDPVRIEQVLGNLISNAAKYGDPEAAITISLTQRGPEFELGVTSRGQGILPEDQPNLFRRFNRIEATRGRIPGLGLGLYICKGLVEAHGGRIRVESIPGETTTFYFTIPRSTATLQTAGSGRESAQDGA